jgi:Holliday junction resolvasome RuvABC ATP-dependent DNA helicase subunit
MNGLVSSLVSFFLSNSKNQNQQSNPEEKFFASVVGYGDLKKLFMKSIRSKEPVHILLTGAPSTSKTVFLLDMLKGLDDAYFVDATAASGPGMIDHLFEGKTKYLLIDEIDKLKKIDQAVLLNVMETGIASETKSKGKTRQRKIKLWIYATSNSVEKLTSPLRSRFMEFHLEEYKFQEFQQIARIILKARYNFDEIVSVKIIDSVWNKMKSRDMRDVVNLAKLTSSYDDIDWLANVRMKYVDNRNQ